jgi:hypothetical protein
MASTPSGHINSFIPDSSVNSEKSRQKRRKLSTQFNHERNSILDWSITSLRELGSKFQQEARWLQQTNSEALFM